MVELVSPRPSCVASLKERCRLFCVKQGHFSVIVCAHHVLDTVLVEFVELYRYLYQLSRLIQCVEPLIQV